MHIEGIREQLGAGLDPSTVRKAKRRAEKHASANTFEAVAREWYDKQAHIWVAKHAGSVKRRLEIDLFPKLGKYPIDQIDAPELLDTIGDRKTWRIRPRPSGTATRQPDIPLRHRQETLYPRFS